ncbi:MAG: phosphoribosylformylglycinamidine synthase subunit PurS, partial [Planctomycetia bacterium]|nr:phosphoribosylformylglycinamidine synthase subunit PurS [Planctomycetia bacterium]
MVWQIEVASKPAFPDVHADGVLADIRALGISGADSARSARLFFIDTDAAPADVERIARELLSDPVVEEFTVTEGRESVPAPPDAAAVIVVSRKTGVMDPVANSTRAAIADMGIEVAGVRTARKYYLGGSLAPEVLATIASKILANDCIEDVAMEDRGPKEFTSAPPHEFKLIHVPVTGADDEELQTISRDGGLFLNLREMQTIKHYYSELGRDPTDAELETIAQTWSEHCGHKTFRGTIRYNGRIIDNLMKSTIARVTEELALPWCISVFKDNAGIIEFDDKWNICFKVETHNHPSALEPYGGSATGIGGVIRDPMGTGLGARPILNTDVFCFAPPDYPLEKVPAGVLHPRRVLRGVVSGARDYGNRMG